MSFRRRKRTLSAFNLDLFVITQGPVDRLGVKQIQMSRARILVTSNLPGNTQDSLRDQFDLTVNSSEPFTYDELLKAAADKDAIISILTNRIDENFFASCPRIKLVANVAVGYDNIDLAAASKRGIIVSNTPGVLTETTADLAFALILSSARRTNNAEIFLRKGKWKRFALDLLLGVDVHHKTLGLIGFGRIGQAVAARARGFSMKVLYSQRKRASEEIENALKAQHVSLEELLQQSDFVSLHCPLNTGTQHLIGRDQLRMMKENAILINTARGAIVDEAALCEALSSGIIGGAGLDVFEEEPKITEGLLTLQNVVLLPHIGSASIETRTAMGQLAVDAVRNSFLGKMPENLINKDCWESFQHKLRVDSIKGADS